MILTVIGFLAILIVALYLTFAAGFSWFGSIALTGKTESGVYIFFVLSMAAWFVVYYTWPFSVILEIYK